ncbi:hypothetical protein PENSPDRAFT_656587 [Peniophora sp. CONT]|nr:hypothetical protein PENSPDRAFT_656587 [Peniophora sp. CONT]
MSTAKPTTKTSNGVPFSHFISLCRAIAEIEPVRAGDKKRESLVDGKSIPLVRKRFRKWIEDIRKRYSPLPLGTFAAILHLLFPEADVDRKYSMQEKRLGEQLAQALGVSTQKGHFGDALKSWNQFDTRGCLGVVVQGLFQRRAHEAPEEHISSLTVNDVDRLLTELARYSPWSSNDVRHPRDTTEREKGKIRDTLARLYSDLPPFDAAVLTQIILKDLRPILYPLGATGTTASLLSYNANAVYMLTLEDALRDWNWPSSHDWSWVWWSYHMLSDLSSLGQFIEQNTVGTTAMPRVGTRVLIPKCAKGRGCKNSLNVFKKSTVVWAETKYDGERAQIHVWVDVKGKLRIKIFSKQGRDSTLDRFATHATIREALGYCPNTKLPIKPKVQKEAILEAEMVAFNVQEERIDEFWHIRSLVENTAHGVRHRPRKTLDAQIEGTIPVNTSMESNAPDDGKRHLALVFFDILLLDSQPLHHLPYHVRRANLEQTINVKHGYSMLAARQRIQIRGPNGVPRMSAANAELRRIFSEHVADYEEGVVLKADESQYREVRRPWVKLKKDYVPGYGDCLDMAVVGAGWNKERGRELRVAPSTFTTFYLGALTNSEELARDRVRPSFAVYFTVSYGPARSALEDINITVQQADHVKYVEAVQSPSALPYTFTLAPGLDSPEIMLTTPRLAEIYGAGFSKAVGSKIYELRWPRLTKMHRAEEREWREGQTLEEIQRIAHEVVGRPSDEDSFRQLWQHEWRFPSEQSTAVALEVAGLRTPAKRARIMKECMTRLEIDDGVFVPQDQTLHQDPVPPPLQDCGIVCPSSKDGERLEASLPLLHRLASTTNISRLSDSPPRVHAPPPTPPSSPRKRRAVQKDDENAHVKASIPDSPQRREPASPSHRAKRRKLNAPASAAIISAPVKLEEEELSASSRPLSALSDPSVYKLHHTKTSSPLTRPLLPEPTIVMPKADAPPRTSTSISYGRRAKSDFYLAKLRHAKAGLPQTLGSAQHVNSTASAASAPGPSSSSLPTPPTSSPPPPSPRSQSQGYPQLSLPPRSLDDPSPALLAARALIAGCWVYLGLPHGTERPPWMRDPLDLYSDSQAVNSWQSILHVCGWTPQKPPTLAPSSGVQRGGIILLDLEARDPNWSSIATEAMSVIEACQKHEHTRFDFRVLDIGVLGNGAIESMNGSLSPWLRHARYSS